MQNFWVSCLHMFYFQGDHLSGKPGNVRDFTKSQEGKSGLKLFIVSYVFVSIIYFAELVHFILVLDHALLHYYPTTDNNFSTGMI